MNMLSIVTGLVEPPAIPAVAQKSATVVMQMDKEPTYKAHPVSEASRCAVLLLLAGSGEELKPFQIAERTGLSASTVSNTLAELYALKRVDRRKAGPTSAYVWRALHLLSEGRAVQHEVSGVLRPAPEKRGKKSRKAGGDAGSDRAVSKGAKPRANHRSAKSREEELEARIKELESAIAGHVAAVRTGVGLGAAWRALQEVVK